MKGKNPGGGGEALRTLSLGKIPCVSRFCGCEFTSRSRLRYNLKPLWLPVTSSLCQTMYYPYVANRNSSCELPIYLSQKAVLLQLWNWTRFRGPRAFSDSGYELYHHAACGHATLLSHSPLSLSFHSSPPDRQLASDLPRALVLGARVKERVRLTAEEWEHQNDCLVN